MMAEYSRPWSGVESSGQPVGDGTEYSADQWQEFYQYGIGGKALATGAVIPESGVIGQNPLFVQENSPVGRSVVVSAGAALCYGVMYINDGQEVLTISANTNANARIDTIVLEWNSIARRVRLARIEGVPAATPSPPALSTTGTTRQIPLADIQLAASFTTVRNAHITQRSTFLQGSNGLDLQIFFNGSGQDIEKGMAVSVDTAVNRGVKRLVSPANCIGAAAGPIANNAWGLVCNGGVMDVQIGAAVTRGQRLVSSTTAGKVRGEADSLFSSSGITLGIALESKAAGFVKALINLQSTLPLLNTISAPGSMMVRTGKALVMAAANDTGRSGDIRVRVDGVDLARGYYSGGVQYQNAMVSVIGIKTGLSVGSHTFTANAVSPTNFYAAEIL